MAEDWLRAAQAQLRSQGTIGFAGGGYDNWDLEIRGGLLGGLRTRLGVEEHGSGKQLLRFRAWPVLSRAGLGIVTIFGALAVTATLEHDWMAAALLCGFTLSPAAWLLDCCARAQAAFQRGLCKVGAQKLGET